MALLILGQIKEIWGNERFLNNECQKREPNYKQSFKKDGKNAPNCTATGSINPAKEKCIYAKVYRSKKYSNEVCH